MLYYWEQPDAYPKTITDALQAVSWLFGGEIEDILGTFRGNLFAHDLPLRNCAKLDRDKSARVELDQTCVSNLKDSGESMITTSTHGSSGCAKGLL